MLRVKLSDLVHRYASLTDQRRVDEIAALFSPGGVLVLPDPPEQPEAHREVGAADVAVHLGVLDQLTLTVHEIVGEVYDEAGEDRATGRVACVAHHVTGQRNVVWHLHYDDTYIRGQGTWRFLRRELHIDFIDSQRVSRHR